MVYQWLNIVGLFLDLIGAVILSYGLMVGEKEAINLGVSRLCGKTDESNLELPGVKDRLKQAKNAKGGLFLLATGFILQIIANWPK